jgi:corrinoid protein of di/trimethylamine methyltransferase
MPRDHALELEKAVREMDESLARHYAQEALSAGADIADIVERGLIAGIKEVGRSYDRGEIFLPQALASANAFYAAYEILRPHMIRDQGEHRKIVLIGVVEGDIHDIGKNLVKLMIEAHGFHCVDLGRDVPVDVFVDSALEDHADFLAMSTLMTPTMSAMRDVVDAIEEGGLKSRCAIMIGGGPVDKRFAEEIRADFYGEDGQAAVTWLMSQEGR